MNYQRTVFIVDASEQERAVYRHFLEQDTRYINKFIEFSSAFEAIACCKKNMPDLILVDFMLPDADGLEFLEQLKSVVNSNYFPILVLSGQGDESIAVQIMKNGAADYLVKGRLTSDALNRSSHTVMERIHLMRKLDQQQEQQRLIATIALRIRQFLNLDYVLKTAVEEIRNFLKADRVFVYQFDPDIGGRVVAESVDFDWKSLLDNYVENACFCETNGKPYLEYETIAIDDIYKANLLKSHQEILEYFQVKATIIVPIIFSNHPNHVDTENSLLTNLLTSENYPWGLLIADNCIAPRKWQKSEIELLEQLSVQLAIAIQQAELCQNLQIFNTQLEAKVEERTVELKQSISERTKAEVALIQLNQDLELRVKERTSDLERVNFSLRNEIAKRQRIEDVLRDSEVQFRQLAENISQVFFIYTNNYNQLLYISPVFEEIWGCPREKLYKNPILWLKHIYPKDRKKIKLALKKQIETEGINEEYRIIRTNGEIRWIYTRTFLVRGNTGQIERIIGIAEDITKRKEAELEIIHNRDLREVIFNESADAIFLVDSQTKLTIDCNCRAVKLFEASSKNELLGIESHSLQKNLFNNEETQIIIDDLINKRFWSGELEYVTRKGNYFWGNLAIKVINVAGRGMSLIRVTDISERKKRTEQIRHSLEEKETLLKEIHHRVKNNLQIISSLLRMQSRRRLDEGTLVLFQESQNRVQSMALIHEQLYQSPDLSQIDFGEYIGKLTDNLFRSYGVSQRKIAISIETNGIKLALDTAIPCGLLINELVSNSLKYAFPDDKKGKINIQLKSINDASITLTVSDNGIGIPDTLNWQNSKSLGLRIVDSLTRQLKGNIILKSNYGTTFDVTFYPS
jgi:PAS domain S-box-containing protein